MVPHPRDAGVRKIANQFANELLSHAIPIRSCESSRFAKTLEFID
jgi:hypothetical protein